MLVSLESETGRVARAVAAQCVQKLVIKEYAMLRIQIKLYCSTKMQRYMCNSKETGQSEAKISTPFLDK